MAQPCLATAPAKPSRPPCRAGPLGAGCGACVPPSEAAGRPPTACGKPRAAAWLPRGSSGRQIPPGTAVSSLPFLAPRWLGAERPLHPGVQKIFGGVIAGPAHGDFSASRAGEQGHPCLGFYLILGCSLRIQVALRERVNHPAVNYPTSGAAVMTRCSPYLSEEISLVLCVFSFTCWDPDIALETSQHLEQIWS